MGGSSRDEYARRLQEISRGRRSPAARFALDVLHIQLTGVTGLFAIEQRLSQ
jgi:hypothetical protein